MTSATTRSDTSAGGHRAEGRGYGLIFFAAILLFVVGFFKMIYGIAAIANSHVFTANAHYVFANLRAWGWMSTRCGLASPNGGARYPGRNMGAGNGNRACMTRRNSQDL